MSLLRLLCLGYTIVNATFPITYPPTTVGTITSSANGTMKKAEVYFWRAQYSRSGPANDGYDYTAQKRGKACLVESPSINTDKAIQNQAQPAVHKRS